MSRAECETAGGEGALLMKGFFDYHQQSELGVRRLLLAPPPASTPNGSGGHRKRKGPDAAFARGPRRTEFVDTVGATFGCTLGNITGYLEGRGLPGERAYVLRSIRTMLLPAAEALRYMRGADVPHLARGMASCRVVQAQRSALREVGAPGFPKIDHKYGNACTAVGATAAMLVAFGVMSTVPDHAAHFWREGSLWKALRCAEEALASWRAATVYLPEEHWDALNAERRAMHRACLAAYGLWKVRTDGEDAHGVQIVGAQAMQAMLQAATRAAFPSGALVNEFTQATLCERIQREGSIWSDPTESLLAISARSRVARSRVGQELLASESLVVLPLAEIPDTLALVTGGGSGARRRPGGVAPSDDDSRSCASSSWQTLSSNRSGYSHVSQDSLSGLMPADALTLSSSDEPEQSLYPL